jgi:hypothetical protein
MEDWEEVTSGRPSFSLTNPVENIPRQNFMARMPLMVPVSYLGIVSVMLIEFRIGDIPKENTTKSNEQSNNDCRGSRARGIIRPLQSEAHCRYRRWNEMRKSNQSKRVE